jgi:hypothetical protein
MLKKISSGNACWEAVGGVPGGNMRSTARHRRSLRGVRVRDERRDEVQQRLHFEGLRDEPGESSHDAALPVPRVVDREDARAWPRFHGILGHEWYSGEVSWAPGPQDVHEA